MYSVKNEHIASIASILRAVLRLLLSETGLLREDLRLLLLRLSETSLLRHHRAREALHPCVRQAHSLHMLSNAPKPVGCGLRAS